MADPATDNQAPEQDAAAQPTPPDIQTPTDPNAPLPASMGPSGPAAPPKQSFWQGMREGVAGAPVQVTGTGDIASAATARPSVKGTLGRMLVGALLGAAHGAGAPRGGGFGAGFGRGFTAAEQADQARANRNIAIAQQQFQNRQAAQKEQREQSAADDAHMRSVAEVNHYNAVTHNLVMEQVHNEKMYPMLEEEANQRLQNTKLEGAKAATDFLSDLSQAGIDITKLDHADSWSAVTPDHAKQLANGQMVAIPNGKSGTDAGAYFLPTQMLDRPLGKDTSVVTGYQLDSKTHEIKEVRQTLPGTDSARTALALFMSGQKQRQQLVGQEAQRLTEIKTRSEADKAEAEATKARADAASEGLGTGGQGPDWTKQGADFLATLNPEKQALIKSITNYQAAFSDIGRGKDRAQVVAAASHYDPSFSETMYKPRQDMIKDYTSGGKTFEHIQHLNTAINHLGILDSAAQALNNGQVQDLNKIANQLGVKVGATAPVTYEAIRQSLLGEIGQTYKGSSPTDPELEALQRTFNAAQSPQQARAAINGTIQLIAGRLDPLQTAFTSFMGKKPEDVGITVVTPRAAQVLKGFGFTPTGQRPESGQGGGLQVPQGKVPAYSKSTGKVIGYADDANGTNFVRF